MISTKVTSKQNNPFSRQARKAIAQPFAKAPAQPARR